MHVTIHMLHFDFKSSKQPEKYSCNFSSFVPDTLVALLPTQLFVAQSAVCSIKLGRSLVYEIKVGEELGNEAT